MARRNSSFAPALGGVLAALAVVIMCMGTLIPMATFACPMLCICLLAVYFKKCGRRMAWIWYCAVAILSLLMAPDKEAAVLFAFLGYYPILKHRLDRLALRWLWKALLFNASICIMYFLLLHVLGMAELAAEFSEAGGIVLGITLLLGNVTFLLYDRLIPKMQQLLRRLTKRL